YLSNLGRGKFYHVINSPNEQSIGFQQRGFDLANYSIRTLPNYPNYRLYDVPGSLCDTLGIDAPPMVGTQSPTVSASSLSIFPNPASTETTLTLPAPQQGHWSLTDISGKNIREGNWQGASMNLNVAGLPPGLYFFQLRAKNGQVFSGKVAVQR
ncbi:MAG: T9SS type A sorting domain-containing protein, partial [Saprospiraceae bacterium]